MLIEQAAESLSYHLFGNYYSNKGGIAINDVDNEITVMIFDSWNDEQLNVWKDLRLNGSPKQVQSKHYKEKNGYKN